MLKIDFIYNDRVDPNDSTKGVLVRVYHSEASPDGTHLSANSGFNASMIKRLSKKDKEALFGCLQSAIQACIKDVMARKEKEKCETV